MPRLTALLTLILAAISWFSAHSSADAASRGRASPKLAASAERGLAFARSRCAGCHGLTPNADSPNPEAPPFEAIANQRGLTRTTLRDFLRDSHNYPAAMNFTIDRRQIGELADYVLTLRSENYRPAI